MTNLWNDECKKRDEADQNNRDSAGGAVMTGGWLHTDFGRVRVSSSVARTTLIVETEVGEGASRDYRRQVLRGSQIDSFEKMVTRACLRVLRDDEPESA